ncbi:MAG: type II toxin-antitoxin system HicB family antitoxin [Chloroflexota bacterium]
MFRYRVMIGWSDVDRVYVARVPQLPGCMAHGDSYEEALHEAETAMELWVSTAREFGRAVPEPERSTIAV